MAVDSTKQLGGFALLIISSVLIFAIGLTDVLPVATGAVPALGLAAGSLLVGTAGTERPV